MENSHPKTILIAPLNWGLGHATRCIPIIRVLQENNCIPIIASDGIALDLLRKEFPDVKTLELPSYHIQYPQNGKNFKWKLIQSLPKITAAIWKEKRIIQKWIEEYKIDGIISDNRLGVFSSNVPSVYLTHQLNVLTGNTTWFSSKLHQHFIKKYTQCWVPDFEAVPNLTGKLGHLEKANFNIKYIGPLSRIQKKDCLKKHDLLIVLSGPEPQRSLLEEKLRKEILYYKGNIVFVQGIVEKEQKKEVIENVSYYNFCRSQELELLFNESETILCRSGYTSIMDLVQLQKKVFFIPTPGQYEQEYLAQKLMQDDCAPYAQQSLFKIENLEKVQHYKGLPFIPNTINWDDLFQVFE